MPELPEVQTTVNGINKRVLGRKIVKIETSYKSTYHKGKDNIKNPKFLSLFKKRVRGKKIIKAERRAKNILINLSGDETILVHMKMTGHFVYDYPDYPFTRLSFQLDNGKSLSLSDMRKFAKVTLIKTSELDSSLHLANLGPEPLEKKFQFPQFKSQIMRRPKGKIKQVLLDQSLISGIGNIYGDEVLWRAGVHPLSQTDKIPDKNLKEMFKALKITLKKGIDLGGDSVSDYRNIEGKKGEFQEHHRAYQRTGLTCSKSGCGGKIRRVVVGARSAHYCDKHQKLYK